MKTKTLTSSVLALVVALSISMLALVGCANTPEDNPEDNPTIEATEGAENAEATDEQTEDAQATEAPDGADTASQSDNGSNDAYTPSQGASGSNSGAKSSGNSGATQSAPKAQSAPSQPAHTHNWVDITETRTVTDKAAWDEPIEGIICSCGKVFTDKATARAHIGATGHASGGGIVDYKHHPAQTHTETVVVGQRCSSCGATK